MRHPFPAVALFAIAVLLALVALAETVTRLSGEGGHRPSTGAGGTAVSVEAGEAIFWGRGKCSTCHAVGGRGAAVRGPDQGAPGPLGLAIGARAAERARERSRATGRAVSAADYLVESLVEPGAYVVEGFRSEMPDVTRPPIALGPDELRAVVLYLLSLGGQPDPAAIQLPARLLAGAAADAAPALAWQPYPAGDPRRGEALFFDPEGSAACGKCHRVRGRGGAVGPDLTEVAGVRDARFIVEAILDPSREIASGYEPVLIVTAAGLHLTGVVRREDAGAVELVDGDGERRRIPRREIRQRSPQGVSLMPGNFGEILTVQEFHDLLAFVLSLR